MKSKIQTKDIARKGIRLTELETDIPIYDKYCLSFLLNNGERTQIYLYADKGSIPPRTPVQGKVLQFFLGFLIENETISQNRIYLGSFHAENDGKPVNDRFSPANNGYETKQSQFDCIMESIALVEAGKISQQELEESFPEIYEQTKSSKKGFKQTLKVTGEEPVTPRGKHYALGDVHGHKEAYDTAMSQLGEHDSIVLLGDVIDRGKDGTAILLDLIKRGANTEKSNIRFLLGNHELMMLESLDLIEKYSLRPEEIAEIVKLGGLMRRIQKLRANFDDPNNSKESREASRKIAIQILESDEWRQYKEKYGNPERGFIQNGIIGAIANWLSKNNGGLETYERYAVLPEETKARIRSFLRSSYVAYYQNVQGQDKLYVHSRPFRDISRIRRMKGRNDQGIHYTEVTEKEADFAVWEREVDTFTPCKAEGFTTICGHQPEFNKSIVNYAKGFICLDEGCGHGTMCTTGLYCIEDGTILHINEIGEIDQEKGRIKVIEENGQEKEIKGTKLPQLSKERE